MIAVGPGAPNKEGHVVPTSVKTGDRVLLPGWGGNAIKLGEEVRGSAPGSSFLLLFKEIDELFFFFWLQEYFLFKDSEILAKIEE